jgi:nicotinamidase-related amidase
MTSALLIIDVQTILCVGRWAVHAAEAVVQNINAVSARARAAGLPVVVVQHEEAEGPMLYDAPGWQLAPALQVSDTDLRLRKTGSDAFHQTDLHALLQARGVDRLIVCGMQTDFCVDSTVRRALALGYPVTLVSDAHSTLDNGVISAAQIIAHHNRTLSQLGSYGPRVTLVPAAQALE